MTTQLEQDEVASTRLVNFHTTSSRSPEAFQESATISHLIGDVVENELLSKLSSDNQSIERETTSGGAELEKLSVKLLLRLVNETFLSLPISGCEEITAQQIDNTNNNKLNQRLQSQQQQQHESEQKYINEEQHVFYDACVVDWSSAKLVQFSKAKNITQQGQQVFNSSLTNEISHNNLETSKEYLITNLLNKQTNLPENHSFTTNSNSTDTFVYSSASASSSSASLSSPSQSTFSSSSFIDYNFAKLTYLSVSSFLSICGIIVNLFIILIIIFNTKQKRRSVIRSNNTGQNNLLLFQLTLTGFLLAGYVLIENINIQQQHQLHQQHFLTHLHQIDPTNSTILNENYYNTNDDSISTFTLESSSSMSTLLPPTLFDATENIVCRKKILETTCNNQPSTTFIPSSMDSFLNNSEVELIDEVNQEPKSSVLILKFNDNDLEVSNSRISTMFNDNKSNWYLHSSQESNNDDYLLDVANSLEAMFVAKSDCKHLKKQVERESEEDVSVSDESFINNKISESSKVLLNDIIDEGSRETIEELTPRKTIYTRTTLKYFLISLVPLLVNVIASVHVWTVAALAYDRYCAIANPLQYLRSIHASRTKRFLVLSWSISLMMNLLTPLLLSQLHQDFNSTYSSYDNETKRLPTPSMKANTSVDRIVAEEKQRIKSKTMSLLNGIDFNLIKHRSERDMKENIEAYVFQDKKLCTFTSNPYSYQQVSLNQDSDLRSNINSLVQQLTRLWSPSPTQQLADEPFTTDKRKSELKESLLEDIISLLVDSSYRVIIEPKLNLSGDVENQIQNADVRLDFFISVSLTLSLLSFVMFILVPLLVITVCSISIYKIVKVHERRLSVSSGNNNITPISQANVQRLQNFRKETCQSSAESGADDKSDAGSITSLLVGKLMKIGFVNIGRGTTRNEDMLRCNSRDQEAYQSCLSSRFNGNKSCDCDETLSEMRIDKQANKSLDGSTTIVNRSKRLIARQDSYQLLARLTNTKSEAQEIKDEQEVQNTDGESPKKQKDENDGTDIIINSTNTFNTHHQQRQKQRIKRKISDFAYKPRTISRGSSFNNYEYRGDQSREFEADNRSYHETTQASEFQQNNRYDGILGQLKLAGLSFAGIAIQEPNLMNNNARSLNKGSSCSLGNLNTIHHNCSGGGGGGGGSISRCSVETSSTISCPKRSFVSLNNHPACQTKCTTKLITDADSDNSMLQSNLFGPNVNFHQPHNRLPSTIGTKSAAFNVVIWLILTMLILTVPHYLLVTVNQINRMNRSFNLQQNPPIFDHTPQQTSTENNPIHMINSLLEVLLSTPKRQILADNSTSNSQETKLKTHVDQSLISMGSLWLSCLCRIIFLSMLPLNGWLYGIRSRSLRAKVRMILKRYISRRQASIEINHRQRSISSVRSRNSSFISVPPLYYLHNASACKSCNYQLSTDDPDKIFPRCSSFTAKASDCSAFSEMSNQLNCSSGEDLTLNATLTNYSQKVATSNEFSKVHSSNNSTIRFVIGDYNVEKDLDNTSSLPLASPGIFQYSSQNTSQGSSLTGSSRSLLSNSVNPGHLMCGYSLFDHSGKNMNDTIGKSLNGNHNANISKQINHSIQTAHDKMIIETIDGIESSDSHSNTKSSDDFARKNSTAFFKPNSPHSEDINNHHKILADAPEIEYQLRHKSTTETPNVFSFQSNRSDKSDSNKYRCQVKKSQSEFKLIVTAADQQEQHVLDYSTCGSKFDQRNYKFKPKKEMETTYDGLNYSTEIQVGSSRRIKTSLSPLANWWKQLKQNLSKLLLNATVKMITENFLEDNKNKDKFYSPSNRMNNNYRLDLNSSCESKELLEETRIEIANSRCCKSARECYESSLTSNIPDETNQTHWAHSRLSSRRSQQHPHPHQAIKKMRTSLTLNNLESFEKTDGLIGCQCSKHQLQPIKHFGENKCCDSKIGSFNNVLISQQTSSLLMPPNFLKLILDQSNGHTPPYLGSSALSPIKECSSNHSYASSQSSLNNPTQYQAINQTTGPNVSYLSDVNMSDKTYTDADMKEDENKSIERKS